MLEHLTNAKLQLALAGALTLVLVSLMIPVAICVRGLMVPVHACTQAAGLVSQGWHKQYPRQASTVAATSSVSCPMHMVSIRVDVTSSTPSYRGSCCLQQHVIACCPSCTAPDSPRHTAWQLAGLAQMAALAQATLQSTLYLSPHDAAANCCTHGAYNPTCGGPVEDLCRIQPPLLRRWVLISTACIPANPLRTAGTRCVQAAEQAGYSHLPHLDLQSASSTDEDIEVDHRVHGAAALLPSVSPSAAAAAAQPDSALGEMGHVQRHADSSEQQNNGGHKPVMTWTQLLLLSAHAASPEQSRPDSIRP